ncbi:MAG: 16S rRNA (cytosine(1402)-N(4))-methyltransferase RsmH [Peptostreptococcaceae bacterium]|nr:16S rRNA (cytosine(1402)-N(4))-methyltransferase RsmH [Peptostreptococcaceae bacterium]
MEFKHVSVLYEETINSLKIKPDGIYVDGTLGGGGHSSGICEKLNENGLLIGIDRDNAAIDAAGERLNEYNCKKIFVHDNYNNIKEILKELNIEGIDGAVMDLGVSSFQLDNGERGFSYMQDVSLDMRMNEDDSFSAYDVVNTYSEKELFDVINKYGEEKWAARIVKFILNARKEGDIKTTGEVVSIIKAAIPAAARRDGPHPAKRTFQAIRIEVNGELDALEESIDDYLDVLKSKGRLSIITFHSLEDRIVKEKFNDRLNPCTCPKEFPICVCGKVADVKKVTKKPIIPTEDELEVNPRSRSAKLRVIEKL